MFLAALLGKPIGVLAAVAVSLRLGLRFPDELGWRELVVVAFTASIGFTSALWLAASAVPIGPVLLDFKSGALRVSEPLAGRQVLDDVPEVLVGVT